MEISFYAKKFYGPKETIPLNKPLKQEDYLNHWRLGTKAYKGLHKVYSLPLIREFSYSKAMGPDLVPDTWIKQPQNQVHMNHAFYHWVNSDSNMKDRRTYLWILPKTNQERYKHPTRPDH